MDKNLRDFAIKLYNKTITEYSVEDANDYLRKYIKNICGGEFTYYTFQENRWKVYAILSEVLTQTTGEISREIFEPIAEFKDTALGDRIDYTVENPELFEVAVIASGTTNLNRQKLLNDKVQTTAFDLGLKIYADFKEFMAERIDWTKLVNKVSLSFNDKVANLIAEQFASAYDGLDSNLKVSSSMDEGSLLELCEKVSSKTGSPVSIYGTKIALSKIPNIENFVTDAQDIRSKGYISMFKGIDCVELRTKYRSEGNKWVLPNDMLYIIPSSVKPILMGFEGDVFIKDSSPNAGTDRVDMQIEMVMMRRLHLAVLKTKVWGAYKISA